ncbi:MAG: hypothetical protein KME13_03270 [Myxacorys californica WJT36-NPBG1]|jgi:hypothetical protein|nr:hypothetical protein [Myxacorys californica WJT36-NPBG1]
MTKSVEQTEQFISIVEDLLPTDVSSHNLSTDEMMLDPVSDENADFYEIHSAGPLTYFNYYFETAGASARSPEAIPRSHFSAPLKTGLVGVGLLGASAAVGFLSVKAIQGQPISLPEKTGKISESLRRQNTAKPASTNPNPPEQINPIQSKSTSSSSSPQKAKRTLQQSPVPVSQTTARQKLQQILPIRSANESLSVELSPSLAQPLRKTTASSRTRQTQASLSPAKAATSVKQNIAPPEALIVEKPQTPSFTQSTGTKQVQPQVAPSALLPALQPIAPSASLQGEVVREAPKDLADPRKDNPATSESSSSLEQGATLQRLAKPIGTVGEASPKNRLIDIDQILRSAQSLQELMALPQALPESISAIVMPLTKQAATEVEHNNTPNSFALRKLDSAEYRSEWLQTAKAFGAEASDPSLPSYGFINYQRRVIIIPQSPDLATIVSSKTKVVEQKSSKNKQ